MSRVRKKVEKGRGSKDNHPLNYLADPFIKLERRPNTKALMVNITAP